MIILAAQGLAQPLDANHAELKWKTFETEHFVIHFHDGAERTARTIAQIAEEVHPKLAALYDYEPDTKFHFIVKDTDDFANGAAYYYNNKMLIWCTALDYDLRGTVNWLRNVITHEYTHIIQLGSARKMPRAMPAVYFQVLDYEYEKRPDVLYGYPNVLASYPFAFTVMPMWFAEGVAQYNTPDFEYDYWDSHRDMQIRVRALNDSLLPLNDMEVFGKNSFGNESVYNHGFSLVRYIADNYGYTKLHDITEANKKLYKYDFNSAIKEVLGLSGDELYAEWSNDLKEEYLAKTDLIRENTVEGISLNRNCNANLYPLWNAGGDTLYYSSNQGEDYYGVRSVYRKALPDGEAEIVLPGITSPFDISPDGKWMVYSFIVRQSNESYYSDLYLYEFASGKKVRLTRSARAMDPSFSQDGKSLVFIVNRDGTRDLAKLNLPDQSDWLEMKPLDSGKIIRLTDYDDGTQCWRPKFSKDDQWILFAKGRDLGRDIYKIHPDGSEEQAIVDGPGDQRDPVWSSDGQYVYYSSDETGIFNLYRVNLENGEREALSNVLGAALMPSVNEKDQISYVQYTEYGFELRLIEESSVVDKRTMIYDPDFLERLPVINYDDTNIAEVESHPYKPMFESMFVVPRIAWDYGAFKPGIYFYSSDFLEKIFLFGGISANQKKEYDVFGRFEFKPFRPTLFLEGYFIQRKDSQRFDDELIIADTTLNENGELEPVFGKYGIDYTFKLLEVDAGLTMRLATPVELELRVALSKYEASQGFDDLSNFKYTYFKGKYFQSRVDFDFMFPEVRGNVHPTKGSKAQVTVAFEDNDFIEGFEINPEKYTIQEVYKNYKYMRLSTDATTWYNPFGEFVIQPRIRCGYLSDEVDSFMHLYAGGLHGMKGYSYYSMGGTKNVIGSITLRHPLYVAPRPKFGWVHFDGLYAGIFGDVGENWIGNDTKLDHLKSDLGVELRAKLFGWYGFPTAVTFSASRAMNTITVKENQDLTIYDPEWKYYLTVLFDFETIFPSSKMLR